MLFLFLLGRRHQLLPNQDQEPRSTRQAFWNVEPSNNSTQRESINDLNTSAVKYSTSSSLIDLLADMGLQNGAMENQGRQTRILFRTVQLTQSIVTVSITLTCTSGMLDL
jgi:hypothetical protein